jgi:hypothetical protein
VNTSRRTWRLTAGRLLTVVYDPKSGKILWASDESLLEGARSELLIRQDSEGQWEVWP